MNASPCLSALRVPRHRNIVVASSLAVLLAIATSSHADTSQLWGKAGEKWSPKGRLADFSFAGYRRGEEPYRIPREQVSIASLGAKGDGKTDDTAAFQRAIAAGRDKLVVIPEGRYVLSDVLEIQTSRLVLRGAGSDKTVLLFEKPLEVLRPRPAKTDGNQPTTGWSWGGGLIMIGSNKSASGPSTRVVEPARRGDNRLVLEKPRYEVGDELTLTLRDDGRKSLLDHLYRGQAGNTAGLNNWTCRQVFRIVATSEKSVTLDRPLRFDVRPEWRPAVVPFRPAVTDVGVEGIAIEFPANRYGGHFREVGYNAAEIGMSAAHCWLRDIRIWNADSGPYVRGTFCTLEKIRLGADPGRESTRGHTGHHGISFYGHDSLSTDFSIETEFLHDITVQSAMGCVASSGRAVDLCMDHHRWAPYENLFTDIDAGEGSRLFASSGGGHRGNHTAAGTTFWNIRAKRPAAWPKSLGCDFVNVVGVRTEAPTVTDPDGRWLESIPPERIEPQNLHAAMRERRRRH